MSLSLYKVTLSHSTGLRPIWVTGVNEHEAMDKACDYENAPRSAVVFWDNATDEEARKWSRVLGI